MKSEETIQKECRRVCSSRQLPSVKFAIAARWLLLLALFSVAISRGRADEAVGFSASAGLGISGNEQEPNHSCDGFNGSYTDYIPFSYTFNFLGTSSNSTMLGCCGIYPYNDGPVISGQFPGQGSYNASVSLTVRGEICDAGIGLSGIPGCFNTFITSTPTDWTSGTRPHDVNWQIQVYRNTNSIPAAIWDVKDMDGNAVPQVACPMGHYKLPPGGTAVATVTNTDENPNYVIIGDPHGCTLSGNVFTAGTNNYNVTVQVQEQLTNADVCLSRDFYFDITTCKGCSVCPDYTPHSVYARWPLGPSRIDAGEASLQIKSALPDVAIGSPQLLRCDESRPELEVITNSAGWLRQVRALDRIVDIVTNSAVSYSLLFYLPSDALPKTNGVYVFVNAPYQTVTIQLVNGDTNQVRITDSLMPAPLDYVWGGTGWTLTSGNGLRNETLTVSQVGAVRTEVRTVKNAQNVQEGYSSETWQTFSVGDRLLEAVSGSGSNAKTNSYTYTTNGLTTQRLGSDGSWNIYQYDSMGRQIAEYSPFTNSAPTTNASLCRVVSSIYSNSVVSGSGNDAAMSLFTPREVTESVLGVEVSRRYAVIQLGMRIDIQCVNPGAAWNDPSNLFTTNYFRTDVAFLNQPWKIINPDGTMQLFAYSGVPLSQKTVWTGAPDATFSSVVDGTREVTSLDNYGRTSTHTVTDIASSILISSETYGYDARGHLTNTTYLDGTHASRTYDCCNMISSTDREGTVTTYSYDALKRQVAVTRNGITTSNILDSVGNVISTVRYGTDGTSITTSQTSYDDGGEQVSSIDALNNTTSSTNYLDANGQFIRVTTYPDLTTRIETYSGGSSLMKVTGTAVHGIRHEYGVQSDGGVQRSYTKEIKLDASGNDTSEWTKTFTDGAGRAYKVVYADATGSPSSQSFYNTKGQLAKQVDPDGITTLYQYNSKGQGEYTATDVNTNGVIDFAGTDRIVRSVTFVTTNATANVQRTESYVWSITNSAVSNIVSATESSVDGLHTWRIVYRDPSTPITNRTDISYAGNGIRYLTDNAPDNSYTSSQYQFGRPVSVTQMDGVNAQVAKTTYDYDAHGRQLHVTDARNGATTYGYNNADMVVTVTTPAPGNGQAPQTTTTSYNNRLQVTSAIAPDGATKNFEYYATGELKRSWSGRDYPVGYTYDYAGRAKTMTNWTSFSTGAGARVTTWNYDVYRGWLTNKTYDGGSAGPNYTYTAGGRLKTRQWARIGLNSQRILTTYTYGFNGPTANNAYGDLIFVTYTNDPLSTPTVTNSYDRLGRTASVIQNGITNIFAYNTANQVLSETNRGGILKGWGTTNVYDSLLRRTSFQIVTGAVVKATFNYGYDAASRLFAITNGNYNASYTYLANSPLVSQITFRSNAITRVTTTKSYDYLNRLTGISSAPSGASTINFNYNYNDANQRVRVNLADGSFWMYEYDSLGQVTSGKRYWSDGTPVAGQQFEYAHDDIGNRTATKAGGDETGANLRSATYGANNLNQYTNRTVPGAVDVMGIASAGATVTVNTQAVYRHLEYYRKELPISNTTTSRWQSVTNKAVQGTTTNTVIGNVFLAKTNEVLLYDADGNLVSDGRWTNLWDAENRLVNMTSLSNAPTASKFKLDFAYDYMGRRLQKVVSTNSGSAYVVQYTNRFIYDGWNLAGVLNQTNGLLYSFLSGNDLSGSMQGAGGVGGLLAMTVNIGTNAGTYFYCYDGNGNVAALVNGTNGAIAAQYEYGPFSEVIRANGTLAKMNPFRFSTKYQDDESDLLYYGFRYYAPTTGRWINHDPVAERGGLNLYAFISNHPNNAVDPTGLWAIFDSFEHNTILDTYFDLRNSYNSILDSLPSGLPRSIANYYESALVPTKVGISVYRFTSKNHPEVRDRCCVGIKLKVGGDLPTATAWAESAKKAILEAVFNTVGAEVPKASIDASGEITIEDCKHYSKRDVEMHGSVAVSGWVGYSIGIKTGPIPVAGASAGVTAEMKINHPEITDLGDQGQIVLPIQWNVTAGANGSAVGVDRSVDHDLGHAKLRLQISPTIRILGN
jgi:RHS repeat-associated protein